ncbi:hypothetical protein ABZ436_29875 [Micromonospora matsumotoense]|uniref:hypothetical protein n=1 Tax=Micromonospora matsumotoense TaxID=121616 RepID=UPI0033E52D04
MRKHDRPVPMTPRHRRDWSRWGRHCTCGLRWPCPDRLAGVPLGEPPPPRPPTHRPHLWNGPTAAYWVGTAGLVTRGQAGRANGRHR